MCVAVAPGHNLFVVIFGEGVSSGEWVWSQALPFVLHALTGFAYEDEVANAVVFREVGAEGGVVDAPVETAENQCVNWFEGIEGGYSGFGDGADGVVVEGDAVVGAHLFEAVGKAVEGGQGEGELFCRDAQQGGGEVGGIGVGEVVVAVQGGWHACHR